MTPKGNARRYLLRSLGYPVRVRTIDGQYCFHFCNATYGGFATLSETIEAIDRVLARVN